MGCFAGAACGEAARAAEGGACGATDATDETRATLTSVDNSMENVKSGSIKIGIRKAFLFSNVEVPFWWR